MKKIYKVLSSVALAGIIGTMSITPLTSSVSAAKADVSTTVSKKAEANQTKKAPAAIIKKAEQTLKKLTKKEYKLDKSKYIDGLGWDFNVKGTPSSQILIDAKGNIKSGYIEENEITTFFEKNKISHTEESLANEDASKEDIAAAEEVFSKLGLPVGELAKITLQHKGGHDILEFMYTDGDFGTWINVDQATHKVVGFNARELADDLYGKGQEALDEYNKKMKALTPRQLQDSGVPQAELLLGLDLNGHMLEKKAFPSDVVIFTKEGEPTVEGNYNSDGTFFNMQIVYN
ncbi:hypothetical protein PAECIP112173_04054 [Paenibacillus sp. JJ-100]|uniref:hypothetical protein n=1 Tax=Paenibacillus sp. JJ-100 TaxID=2974896 RepID=UPI0022FF9106|nr:hypothetical protein [Paenibacillus sp. JJ-100]CAI6083758.1 hypothetical protein PAECIP112173_04054 [Paenibacillus sp. JJ-100]